MKRFLALFSPCSLIIACLTGPVPSAPAAAGPRYPFPQHSVYAPGTIRPNYPTQAQQDEDVRAFYTYWNASYLVEAGTTPEGNPLFKVTLGSTAPETTVSESQGYGMIIVALMAGYDQQAQVISDGLWEFSRAHPSDNDDRRLMGWQVPPTPGSNYSAFDGDADIAYALLLVDKQWGSAGRIS